MMEVRMDVVMKDLFMDDLVCFVMYHRLDVDHSS